MVGPKILSFNDDGTIPTLVTLQSLGSGPWVTMINDVTPDSWLWGFRGPTHRGSPRLRDETLGWKGHVPPSLVQGRTRRQGGKSHVYTFDSGLLPLIGRGKVTVCLPVPTVIPLKDAGRGRPTRTGDRAKDPRTKGRTRPRDGETEDHTGRPHPSLRHQCRLDALGTHPSNSGSSGSVCLVGGADTRGPP